MARAGDGDSASGLREKGCTVASQQLEGTDLEQDGTIMGPACCFLCPSGPSLFPYPTLGMFVSLGLCSYPQVCLYSLPVTV